jgi:hypothetical protein
MAAYYDSLLEVCGWEATEIEQERPRIQKAFQKLRIGPEDMGKAEAWVRQNHDVTLKGVRMLLRAYLMETIDMVLAKDEGKKLIFYSFPAMVGPVFLIAASAENTYVGCPDMVLCSTLGQIFNKLSPVLEAGEENGIPPGHGLCSLWQIKVGMLAKGIMPPPDMGIAAGYYCDMGCKADGYLEWKYGCPVVYLDGSIDSEWGEFPDFLPERVEFIGAELNHLFDRVREVVGVEVRFDEEVMARADFFREFYKRILELNQLVMETDPVPLSTADTFLTIMLMAACTGRGVTEGYKALNVLIEETRERIDRGVGVTEKGAPRVLLLFGSIPDASVVRMIESTGLAVPTTVFYLFPAEAEPKGAYPTFGEILADFELQLGIYHSSYASAELGVKAIDRSKVDGYVFNYQFNCRPAAMLSHLAKKWADQMTGVPVLSLENDYFDPRNYSAAAMRTRVETFAQMLKAKKASAPA